MMSGGETTPYTPLYNHVIFGDKSVVEWNIRLLLPMMGPSLRQ